MPSKWRVIYEPGVNTYLSLSLVVFYEPRNTGIFTEIPLFEFLILHLRAIEKVDDAPLFLNIRGVSIL